MAAHSGILAWRTSWTEEPGVHGVTKSQTRLTTEQHEAQLHFSGSKLQLPGFPGSKEPAPIGRKLQFPEFREPRKRSGLGLRRRNRRACARAQLTREARQLGRRTSGTCEPGGGDGPDDAQEPALLSWPPRLRAGGWGSGGHGLGQSQLRGGPAWKLQPRGARAVGAGEVRALAAGKGSETRLGLELKELPCDLPRRGGEERRGVCGWEE